MSKIKWRYGQPPSVGWWPASIVQNKSSLRWWNGDCWSHVARSDSDAAKAGRLASLAAVEKQHYIQWCDRPASWPERSRT